MSDSEIVCPIFILAPPVTLTHELSFPIERR